MQSPHACPTPEPSLCAPCRPGSCLQPQPQQASQSHDSVGVKQKPQSGDPPGRLQFFLAAGSPSPSACCHWPHLGLSAHAPDAQGSLASLSFLPQFHSPTLSLWIPCPIRPRGLPCQGTHVFKCLCCSFLRLQHNSRYIRFFQYVQRYDICITQFQKYLNNMVAVLSSAWKSTIFPLEERVRSHHSCLLEGVILHFLKIKHTQTALASATNLEIQVIWLGNSFKKAHKLSYNILPMCL